MYYTCTLSHLSRLNGPAKTDLYGMKAQFLHLIFLLLHTLSKLYDVPVGFVIRLHLRQCIALFAVAEGWLLLDIG